jgi:dihydrofolate reductase
MTMRKTVVHTQVTLDNRISRSDGLFWEPFSYGQDETARVNEFFDAADTWVMGRKTYEFVVPFWEQLAAGQRPPGSEFLPPAATDFARILSTIDKVVLSTTLESDPAARREVIAGDVGQQLIARKLRTGRDIIVSAGPATLATLFDQPGLIDELLVVIHPAVLSHGPRMFDAIHLDLALELLDAQVFDAGGILARYAVRGSVNPATAQDDASLRSD